MALPTTPQQWDLAAAMIREYPARLHAERMRLLGLWVSGIEPVEVWDALGVFYGLAPQGSPTIHTFLKPTSVVLRAWR